MTTAAPTGTAIKLDPNTLAIAGNIRSDLNLTDFFVKSIKQAGVLEPVIVYFDTDLDDYALLRGQRRRAGAIKAGLTEIPAYVVDKPTSDTQRTIDQFIENEHRESITEAEQAGVYRQLELAGMPAIQIASKTATRSDRVAAGLAVAKSLKATAAIQEHNLTLDQAAIIAEFEDDKTAIAALVKAAGEHRFDHAAAEQRKKRELRDLIDTLRAELLNLEGFTILPEASNEYSRPTGALRLGLIASQTSPDEPMELEELRGKPGAAAQLVNGYFEVDGFYQQSAKIVYFAMDAEQNGFTRWIDPEHREQEAAAEARRAEWDRQDAERAAARAAAAEARAAFDLSKEVRLTWIAEFLQRQKLPNATTFIAQSLASTGTFFDPDEGPDESLFQLLGIDYPDDESELAATETLTTWLTEHPKRTEAVTLAILFDGEERHLASTWGLNVPKAARYLEQLKAWGYELSEAEQALAAGAKEGE